MASLEAGKATFGGNTRALGRSNGTRTTALFKSFQARRQCVPDVFFLVDLRASGRRAS